MDMQKVADLAEAAALDRFLRMRESFLPCWGAKARVRAVPVRRPRARRQTPAPPRIER